MGVLARLGLSTAESMCFFEESSGRRQVQAGETPTPDRALARVLRVAYGDSLPGNLLLLLPPFVTY